MVPTPTGNGYIIGGIVGGGYIHIPLTEHPHTVNSDNTYHESVYGGGVEPRGAGVPVVIGTGEPGPGGDVDGGNLRYGMGGGWR